MSIEMLGKCWTIKVDPVSKVVLISLADCANPEGECYPAIGSIADRCCLSERSVQRAIQRLIELGLLRAELKASRRGTNFYTLTPDDAPEVPRVEPRKVQKAREASAKKAAAPSSIGGDSLSGCPSVVVTVCHQGGDCVSPEPSIEPNTNTPIPPAEQGAEGPQAVGPEASTAAPLTGRRKASRTSAKAGVLKLADWLQLCAEEGVKPIPADDPVFDYARDVGLTREMVALAWFAFKRNKLASGRGQKDWRATFRNAVRGNWARVWWLTADDSGAKLRTEGLQLQRELAAERERQEAQA